MSLVQKRIKKRGYWKIRIFPASFKPKRLAEIPALRTLVRGVAVETGSISFPIVSDKLIIGTDWVGQDIDAGEYCQAWRFYQSAQLALYEGFIDDWLDQSILDCDNNWKPGAELSVSDVLTTYWQAYEFAARLATAIEGNDPITVSVHAFGLKDRKLLYRFRQRARLRGVYVATIDDFPTETTLARETLIAGSGHHSVEGARELFVRFGWEVDPELLRTLLREGGLKV